MYNNARIAAFEKEFAKKLARIRESRNLSPQEMSKQMGRSEDYIEKLERQETMLLMDDFFDICRFLEASPQEFFQTEDEEQLAQAAKKFSKLPRSKQEEFLKLMEEML